jgi:electron transfer flavoprotein beta subunit
MNNAQKSIFSLLSLTFFLAGCGSQPTAVKPTIVEPEPLVFTSSTPAPEESTTTLSVGAVVFSVETVAGDNGAAKSYTLKKDGTAWKTLEAGLGESGIHVFKQTKQFVYLAPEISSDAKSIDTSAVKWILNPYDEYAVEEAVKTRDANSGSQLWVISMGPKKRVVETLRTALAMGADEAIAIDCAEGLDPLVTAKALATVIKQEGGAKIIFSGKLAIDDNAASVSQMLAEFLEIPHSTVVSKFSLSGDTVLVDRDVEGGAKEIVQMSAPALVGANKGLNMPRYASLPGIMKAKKKVIKEIDFSSLNIDLTNKTKVLSMELPAEKPAVKMMSGDIATQVSTLVSSLRDEAKVL